MSRPVLYTFPASIWASVPQLAIRELGYAPEDIEQKVVNLIEGENFEPSFLSINPKATLPTLVADGKAYTSTNEVISYLVKHAPKPVKSGARFAPKLHKEEYDPNFSLLLARSDEELQQKVTTFANDFVRNRQGALERHSAHPEAAQFKAFYDSKLASNGALFSIYQGSATDEAKQAFFEQSTAHWENVKKFISEDLATALPDTTFFGGDDPSEDDFHLAAWLARIGFVASGGEEQDPVQALENGLGLKLHPKASAYLNAWSSRKSWKEVYAEGLH